MPTQGFHTQTKALRVAKEINGALSTTSQVTACPQKLILFYGRPG